MGASWYKKFWSYLNSHSCLCSLVLSKIIFRGVPILKTLNVLGRKNISLYENTENEDEKKITTLSLSEIKSQVDRGIYKLRVVDLMFLRKKEL